MFTLDFTISNYAKIYKSIVEIFKNKFGSDLIYTVCIHITHVVQNKNLVSHSNHTCMNKPHTHMLYSWYLVNKHYAPENN